LEGAIIKDLQATIETQLPLTWLEICLHMESILYRWGADTTMQQSNQLTKAWKSITAKYEVAWRGEWITQALLFKRSKLNWTPAPTKLAS